MSKPSKRNKGLRRYLKKAEKAKRRQEMERLGLYSQPRAIRAAAPPEVKPKRSDRLKEFYRSLEWKRLSYETRKARGQRCECCGATPDHGARIVCDHIKPIRHHWALRLDAGNVQVLCDDCNRGKGHWDETDWRLGHRLRQPEDSFDQIEMEAQGFTVSPPTARQ